MTNSSRCASLTWSVVPLLLAIAAGAFAQPPEKITVEWIYGGGPQALTATPDCRWRADGRLLVNGLEGTDGWVVLDPATGDRAPAVDAAAATASLQKALGRKPRMLPFPESWDDAGRRGILGALGDVFVFDVDSATFTRVGRPDVEEKSPRLAPDGSRVAFVREQDLWVHDLGSGEERRITADGSETVLNGTLSWVYWEEIFGRQDTAAWWAPDASALAFFRTDDSMVTECVHLDFQPAVPRIVKQRYPKAGGTNPVVRVGIAEMSGERKTTWVTLGDNAHEYVVRVKWLPGGDRLAVQTLDRAHQTLDLWFVDRATGKGTKILTEKDPGWVNVHDDLYFLKDGKHFLWVSERSGWSHLYRYALDGTLVNQVTDGPWALHAATPIFWLRQAVQAIDEEAGLVYFGALKGWSAETHLFRCRLDGTDLQKLTPGRGVHSVRMSPDAKWFVDERSDVGTPPALTLHRADGAEVMALSKARTEAVEALGLATPELFTIMTEDKFPMPARLYKPKDFDPARRHALILHVYGGPSSRTVTDSWDDDCCWNQLLLEKGFLVAEVDNRSATGESKVAENTIAGQMTGDGELKDLLDAVKWFKAQPWIDADRVGIWGWSNGGMMTLLAMTRSAEFKAGVSVAPVTDWTYYDSIWAETVNKRPQDNPRGYDTTNLVRRAKDLHGRLLLVHGTYDDNVHIQNTWHFVDELVKANKRFDLMVYPMRKHGISDAPARIHLFTTMLEFWSRNL